MEENFNTVENMNIDIEEVGSKREFPFSKKTIFIAGIGIVALIILIIIIVSLSSSGQNKNEKDDNSDNQKEVENLCSIGDEDMCLTCKKDKCGSCNLKYTLINGKCEPTFSLRAIYISYNDDEYVELLNYTYAEYITEIEIDGEKSTPSSNYLFKSKGNHTVYMTINTEKLLSLDKIFYQMRKLKSIFFSKKFDTKNITSMERMFVSCSQLTSVDITNFNTENVKSLNYLFNSASKLNSVKLPKSKASKLENINHMFERCYELTSIDFSNFIVDSQYLTSLYSTFSGCHSLTFLNMTTFNTQEVIDMGALFEDCYELTSIDFSNFKTPKLKKMSKMFYRCKKLVSLDLTNFNTGNVNNLDYLFYGCSLLSYVFFFY